LGQILTFISERSLPELHETLTIKPRQITETIKSLIQCDPALLLHSQNNANNPTETQKK